MTLATSLNLDDQELEQVEQLCTEFDPEQFVPEWMKERGDRADWETYLRIERHELRGQLEVAVAFGDSLKRLVDTDFRLRLFYDLASEITKFGGTIEDVEARDRFHGLSTKEENKRLWSAQEEACEVAIRRALFIDSDPQMVAS